MIDHKKRWGIEDEPNWQRFFKKREKTHPDINNWDEFSESEKEILLDIKSTIVSFVGDCKVGICGSRIKGYWIDTSDYDIKAYVSPGKEIEDKILQFPWKYKIDLRFLDIKHFGVEKIILIP